MGVILNNLPVLPGTIAQEFKDKAVKAQTSARESQDKATDTGRRCGFFGEIGGGLVGLAVAAPLTGVTLVVDGFIDLKRENFVSSVSPFWRTAGFAASSFIGASVWAYANAHTGWFPPAPDAVQAAITGALVYGGAHTLRAFYQTAVSWGAICGAMGAKVGHWFGDGIDSLGNGIGSRARRTES